MGRTTFSGPVASDNGFEGNVTGAVAATAPVDETTASLTLTSALHAGRVVTLNRAGGIAVTLEEATGSGAVYKLFVQTTFTSDGVISCEGDGVLAGVSVVANDGGDTASVFETVAGDNTITLDGTTSGGILGTMVILTDVAADLWHVHISTAATGAEATPFSTV